MNNDLTLAELKFQNTEQLDIIFDQAKELERLDKRMQNLTIAFCLVCFVAVIFGMIIIYK